MPKRIYNDYKKYFENPNFILGLLVLLFAAFLMYGIILATKRYTNYEFGKFDLGNMAQMVSNTKNGRFMELTDQFGTNMPRWGMSHVDPIVLIFVPIFFVYEHPMILVYLQHVLIFLAIFPLYYLTLKKTKSKLIAFFVVLAYLAYPANGFSVVWTGFHGISFVAPIFAWLVYFLESKSFLTHSNLKDKIIYWILILLLIAGKEEIGFILALACIFLYFKNKKLAIQTFVVTLGWSLICFLYIIPQYSDLRIKSIDRFVNEVGVLNADTENAKKENFFLMRYSYLGSSYQEIALNAVLKPQLVIKKSFTKDKIESINSLIGPLGYIAIFNPIWLITLPDVLIVLLSSDEIFDISNHRIAFVIISLFISYIYFLSYLSSKYTRQSKYIVLYATLVVILNIYFSAKTNNPIYLSVNSFLQEKIVNKVFAASSKETNIGDVRRGKIPRNTKYCYDDIFSYISSYNPQIYTGPDYLGAQTSLRYVNALFPARTSDADLIVADVFETKAVDPLQVDKWIFNKEAMRKVMDSNKYVHIDSCSVMNLFVKSDKKLIDNITIEKSNSPYPLDYRLNTKKFGITIRDVKLPKTVNQSDNPLFVMTFRKDFGDFDDHMAYWKFEPVNKNNREYAFVDYLMIARNGFDTIDYDITIKQTMDLELIKRYDNGEYRVYYGVGDLLEANEIYIGNIIINTVK